MATQNTATQFSELQKLLINVKTDKCDAFIKAHVNNTWPVGDDVERPSKLPEFTAGENDTYFNKVVFLQKYNAIYTKGIFFGYNGDLKASFDDLFDGLQKGITAKGITVKYNPDATDGPAIETTVEAATYDKDSDEWDNIDNVVTASEVKTYVDAKVAGAVAEATAAMNYCGPIDSTNFDTKKASASNGDVYVVETEFTKGEGDNKETFEKGDLVIFAKDGDADATYTVVERNLDGAIVKGTKFEQGKIVVVESESGTAYTTGYTTGGATFATTGDSSYILATEAGVNAAISDAIDACDHSVTTLTEVSDNDYFSVTEDSTDKTDNDYNYTIDLKVVNLGDAVGMTYDEATGKWSAPEGSTAVNGLASAADVANELVSDEKVIAAALNDHEGRLDVLEAFADDINGTIQDQLVIGDVTVTGLTAAVKEDGLVNVQLLVDVINALDPWEDYE